jgi:hypothetical protein
VMGKGGGDGRSGVVEVCQQGERIGEGVYADREQRWGVF